MIELMILKNPKKDCALRILARVLVQDITQLGIKQSGDVFRNKSYPMPS